MGYFDNYKFRCHNLGELMSEPQAKGAKERGELSASAKALLIRIYSEVKHNRHFERESNSTIKGTEVEKMGVDMYCQYKKRLITQDNTRIENDYLTGEWDFEFFDFVGTDFIRKIVDIKSSYEYDSFIKNLYEPIPLIYRWQVQAYMWLSDNVGAPATVAEIAHCLINTPEWLVEKEINRLSWECSPAIYEQEKDKLLKMHQFDDLPLEERIIVRQVERNQDWIDRIPARVMQGREFLNQLWDNKAA